MGLSRLPRGVVARSTASISLLAECRTRNAQGGIIAGRDVSLQAGNDILNERSVATHQSASGKAYEHQRQMADSAARIEAERDLSMVAGRDLLNVGGALSAGGNATLQAGQDLLLASQQTENSTSRYQNARNYSTRQQIDQYGSDVKVGGDLQAAATRDMAIVGSKVAAEGDMALQVGGSMTIASAANEYHYDAKRKGGGKKVEAVQDSVTQIASELSAGGDLRAVSGQDMNLSASRIDAGGSAYLYSGGQLNLLAAQNSNYSLYDKQSKGSFGAKATRRDEVTNIRHIGTEITTGSDLTLASAGDQLYQRARLDSGADLTLQSGGGITFEGVKDLDQKSHEKSSNSLVWTSTKGKGTTDETLLQTQMIAQGEIAIKAVEGLNIDIKDVDQQTVTQTIDAMVEADPQLAWLKAAEQRGDVDWHRVKEIHDSFKYSHSGLGGGAAIVIAIIVAYFTAGAASGLVASGASTAGASAAATGAGGAWAAGTGAALQGAGWANLAATTVLTGAASNAAISTINNRGNLSAIYKDVTSSDAVKGYAVAGVTAGLTAGLYDGWTGTETTSSSANSAVGGSGSLANSGSVAASGGLSSATGIGQFAANQALQNGTSAILSKALGRDGSLDEALQATLANTFAAAGFNLVGKTSRDYQLGNSSLSKIGLHAIMGGLAAEATGADFRTGALAAGANEALMSTLLKQYDGMSLSEKKSLITMNSQLIGVVAAATLGEDEKGLQTGAWVAGNGTKYNEFGIYDLVPPGAVKYGQAATSLGQDMAVQGASPEEVSTALQAMARGDGYDGPDPAKEFLKAWATTVLTGGGMLGNGARLGTLALGATIGGGSNISYQLSSDLNSISYTDATVAAIVGALSQGKGFLATEALSVSGAYVGSQVKGTDPTGAMIGAGAGAAVGTLGGKITSEQLNKFIPGSVGELGGSVTSSVLSEVVGAEVSNSVEEVDRR